MPLFIPIWVGIDRVRVPYQISLIVAATVTRLVTTTAIAAQLAQDGHRNFPDSELIQG